jgi:hypothetical protein
MKRRAEITILLFSLGLALSASPLLLHGYDNQGPHQMINRLALRILWETYKQRPELKVYTFSGPEALRPLGGESVVQKGDLYEWDQQWFLTVTGVFKMIRPGEKTMAYPEWVEEGGFTADEPELWQALRHFYDPTAPPLERYLTDFKDWNLWAAQNAGRLFTNLPRLNAVDWAVEGPAVGTFRPNEYSWNRGVEFMRRAFHSTESQARKDQLFAAAWRALGETMHLLADMTVPAHVRNDSHPGLGLVPLMGITDRWGSLKKDPYESTLEANVIRADIYDLLAGSRHPTLDLLRRQLDTGLAAKIDAIPDTESPDAPERNIRGLFHALALFTNRNFFSQDTFSGTLDGKPVAPANKLPAYASPKLENCPLEGNYRVEGFPGGEKVLMGIKDWTSTSGWAVTRAVAVSQGRVLVPAALYAGAKMLDWFIPRFQVSIVLEQDTKKLKGRVVHLPYGPYVGRSQLVYNKPGGWKEGVSLYVDGEKQNPALYSLKVEQGLIEGDLKAVTKLRDSKEHTLELELDIGGLRVKSAPTRAAATVVIKEASAFRLTGSYISGPAMACLAYLPRDLGRLTNVIIAWSDYVGDSPVMTASGKDKGLVYLQNRYNPELEKSCWYFALLIPPNIKPGTYSAEINYYLDYQGPFTVPIVIRLEGEGAASPARPDSAAQAYQDYFLNDVKSRKETAAADLENEKQVDITAQLGALRARKAKRRASLEEEMGRLKKALETAQDEETERIRKELQKKSDILSSLETQYQVQEEDLVQRHEQKLGALERLRKELDEWEAAVRSAHRL